MRDTPTMGMASDMMSRRQPERASSWPQVGDLLLIVCVTLPLALMGLAAWTTWHEVQADTSRELALSAEAVAEHALRLAGTEAAGPPRALPDRLLANEEDSLLLRRLDGTVLALGGRPGQAADADAFRAAIAGLPERARFAARDGTGAMLDHVARRVEGQPAHAPAYAIAARPRAATVAAWRRGLLDVLAVGLAGLVALVALAAALRHRQAGLVVTNRGLEASALARAAELADQQAILNGALDAGRVFAFDYDPIQDVVVRSPSAAAILGLPEAEALRQGGSAFFATVHPDDLGRLLDALARLSPARPDYAIRFRVRTPRGEVWLEERGRAVAFAPSGQLARLKSLSRDATAEARADRARREAELRLRGATEGAGIGTFEIDLVEGRAWFDARAALISGLPAEAWLPLDGPDWAQMDAAIHPDDRAAFETAWAAVVEGRSDHWSVETRLRRPDGRWGWDWCHGIAQDPDPATGRPRRIVGVTRDVTERRTLEADLRQAQKLQALGELAGGIAHDFNNILQAVAGTATLTERDAGNVEAVRRRMAALSGAVARGAAITHRLLGFARADQPMPQAVDPAALLHGVAEILSPTLGAAVAVEVVAEPGLPALLADPAQLQTALINLATNARDAMPRGGRLRLAVAADRRDAAGGSGGLAPGCYLRLVVADTGTGMDAATLARVTEPFFTTKPPGKGTGLGLPMAKGFAERAGGGIAIESAPGRGTTVTLWLPAAPSSAVAIGGTACDVASGRLRARVLVVEDDPLVRETLAAQLRGSGLAVIEAGDADRALSLLAEGRAVDALVTDLGMPGMDGLALIEAARRQRPGLPAVLLTGEAGDDAALLGACRNGGPGVLLHKPAEGEALCAGIATLVGARA